MEQSHVWLEYGELIIDITADLFEEITESVIFSDHSEFHENFYNYGCPIVVTDFFQSNRLVNNLPELYKVIIEHL